MGISPKKSNEKMSVKNTDFIHGTNYADIVPNHEIKLNL
jgi:hypothetical protein